MWILSLIKNSKDSKEAENILEALPKNHDGSMLNDSSSVLFNENKQEEGKCILTGKPSKERVLFARAY